MTNNINVVDNKINIYKITDYSSYSFTTQENTNSSLYLYIENNNKITINVKEHSCLDLIIITKTKMDLEHVFNLEKGSLLNLYSSDIILNNVYTNKQINLNGEEAEFNSYEFNMVKDFEVNSKVLTNHNSKNTKASSQYQLLTKGNALIDKEVIANIEKGMTNSNSSELIKGMMMSKNSKINAKPILVVKHDDVKANHGCAIGTVDQNEIYYLMSRGLTYSDALNIISRSFIMPIISKIKDSEFKEFIVPMLEALINE